MSRFVKIESDSLEIAAMPFYWRLKASAAPHACIRPRLPMRVVADKIHDYLKYEPTADEWSNLSLAYRQNENVGFVNPESGQLATYGTAANRFFLDAITRFKPRTIVEIGCGAGFTIQFLNQHGWKVTGFDPSEYSLHASRQLGFPLVNEFFRSDAVAEPADFIYCNDVLAHVPRVEEFCAAVFASLAERGTFCLATTNATDSIAIGDISMLGHQHVNMFTERSIVSILTSVGFAAIEMTRGRYGNTLYVTARKGASAHDTPPHPSPVSCRGYFQRARQSVSAFQSLHNRQQSLHCYVPLRCFPYLATVGDFENCPIYDSNPAWRGRYIDGYGQPIRSVADIHCERDAVFFVGSLTFFQEISGMLVKRGIPQSSIMSLRDWI